MECLQICLGERLQPGCGTQSRSRQAIGVLAIECAAQRAVGELVGLLELGGQRIEQPGAGALDVALAEARLADELCQQFERRRQIGRQRGQREGRPVGIEAGRDIGRQAFLGDGELGRVEPLGAFVHGCQHEPLGAQIGARLGRSSGIEFDQHRNRRHRIAAGEKDLHAVGQGRPLDIGKIEPGERADYRQRVAIGLLEGGQRLEIANLGLAVVCLGEIGDAGGACGIGSGDRTPAVLAAFGALAGIEHEIEDRT